MSNWENTRSIEILMRELQNGQPLSEAENKELVLKWQQGDRLAGDRLCRWHMRYVITLALRYTDAGVPLEDLVAEGAAALHDAMRHYQFSFNTHFLTYAAFWIKKRMLEEISRQDKASRFSDDRFEGADAECDQGDQECIEAASSGLAINRLLHLLSVKDQEIFSLRSGFADGRPWMLSEIAASLGISKPGVSLRLKKIRRCLLQKKEFWELMEGM